MIAFPQFERLLAECELVRSLLSAEEQRTLNQFVALRQRLGPDVVHTLADDDLELLEDWSARLHDVCNRSAFVFLTTDEVNRARAAVGIGRD